MIGSAIPCEEEMRRKEKPEIRITVTDRRGSKGCHRGHKVGDSFDFDTQRGRICPMAMHCAFPYIDILRYGGRLPGQPEGVAESCCSDADVIMVFKAEIMKHPQSKRSPHCLAEPAHQ